MNVLFRMLCLVALLTGCAAEAPPFVAPKERPVAISESPWPSGRLLTLAYHDVDDIDGNQAYITTRTAHLIDQLAWLREQGFQAVSVDQIIAAREGRAPLPDKPLLLSFDDGYSSFHSRVLPILKAYGWPAIMAPVGVWLKTAPNQAVDFGGLPTPRERFLTVEQVRELAQSNLVEIGAHTYASHLGLLANPQGNTLPAVANRLYLAKEQRYETDAELRQRLDTDVAAISATLKAITGKAPRVWVWPYGAAGGTTLQIVGEHCYGLALTLDDGLGSVDDLMSVPRYLVNGDPEMRTFAADINSVQEQGPLRVAHVDLDYVYDPDPARTDANVGTLVQRIADLGVNTVFLQAFADPKGDGNIHALYFPNRHLPMRADLFNRVAWQLRTRAGASVYAWMPVLAFELDDTLPRVQAWDPQTGSVAVAPDQYRRLSPFDPQVRQQIGEIYEDLAKHASFQGILFHDDAVLSDFEDASPGALAAYRQAGLPGDLHALRGDERTLQRWTRYKSRYLIDLTRELTAKVRAIRGPQVLTARNIFAQPILDPQAETWFAQNLDDFLATYDWTAPMAMPLMEGEALEASNAWLDRLVQQVAKRPGALERSVFELQARDWRPGHEAPIEARQLAEWAKRLRWNGVRHYGYYPDDFFNDQPGLETTRAAFSSSWYPKL